MRRDWENLIGEGWLSVYLRASPAELLAWPEFASLRVTKVRDRLFWNRADIEALLTGRMKSWIAFRAECDEIFRLQLVVDGEPFPVLDMERYERARRTVEVWPPTVEDL